MTDGLSTTTGTSLTAPEQTAVTDLVSAAAASDGFMALNEAALLHVRHTRDGVHSRNPAHSRNSVHHVLARRAGVLVGYAQLETDTGTTSGPAASTGQLAVAPSARRTGVGTALLTELVAQAPFPLHVWAMGNTSAAQALAASQHLVAARELLIMTRDLAEPIPPASPPAGVALRTFRVGQDEQEWLAVNASAFRSHPEQGQLTRVDLEDRMTESWFDPEGFFLAVSESSPDQPILGFHWTKQHPDQLGEVYVLGVDPQQGARGLGRSLLSRGLDHLRERGNDTVQLYVEGDSRAVGLYQGYGFAVASRDVMYAQS